MKNKKSLFILLIVSLILFSGCVQVDHSEKNILLTENVPYRVGEFSDDVHVQFIQISGFLMNNTTGLPDKVTIAGTVGEKLDGEILSQKNLGPNDSIIITVWVVSSGERKKLVTVSSIEQITRGGNKTYAANVNIKIIE